ncbi:MAG: DUF3037 domain-containing protein [Terriglobales bacterium]
MAEPLRACEYTLIRIYPDPIRKEFLNIGVCLFEAAGGFAEVRVLDDFRRLHCLFPTFETDLLQALEDDLRSILLRRQGAFDPEQLFYLAGESFAQSLELSPRHGLLTPDPAQAIKDLYQRYVASPPAAPSRARRALTVRHAIVANLREAFDNAGILARLDQHARAASFGAGPDPYRFDFHYRPNGVHNLIQAVDLHGDTRGIKELSFTVSRLREGLRAQGLGLTVLGVYGAPGPRVEVDRDTAVSLAPRAEGAVDLGGRLRREGQRPGGGTAELADYHREILAEARIGLHPVPAAAELAAHIRADLKV